MVYGMKQTDNVFIRYTLISISLTISVMPMVSYAVQAVSSTQPIILALADEEQFSASPRPPAKATPKRSELIQMINQQARHYGVEQSLVHALIRAESNYNPHAVSNAGAIGLMQVMPATAADYGITSAEALFDPLTNVRVGLRHLKRLLAQYSIGQAIMAYNAGEGALERSQGFVSYPETQRYTHKVLTDYLNQKGIAPYSPQARQAIGMTLTPAMAQARPSSSASRLKQLPRSAKALSQLSLRLHPNLFEGALTARALDPALHQTHVHSKPMFILERPQLK
jgi:hypothetical protein